MHAVITAERDEIRTEIIGLLDGSDVSLVEWRIMGSRIAAGRNHAEHLIAHTVETIVGREVARADDPDPGLGQTALGKLFGENWRLDAWKIDECRIRLQVRDTLQVRREIRVGQRQAD